MIGFLFRKVDPNFEFRDKIEDEVPNMYKRLHYPFLISKSALYAVGSPTTWPALLAALAWIVELLSYEERAAEAKVRLHVLAIISSSFCALFLVVDCC